MPIRTITWEGGVDGKIKMVDQTLLPNTLQYIYCNTLMSVWEAIRVLRVRGAPAIGIAGALGTLVGVQKVNTEDIGEFMSELDRVTSYLATARPTAVNLFWALDRMKRVASEHRDKGVPAIKQALLKEALLMIKEDDRVCRAIGKHGAALLRSGDRVITHCNAGGLATAMYGTALSVLFAAAAQGKKIAVFVDETRPLLQGARLTAWELMHARIPATLICDNMAAQVMKRHKPSCVIVGADRIAANGDTANKIGTYGLAVLAKAHGIPFYVAAPLSTFDLSLKSGDQIPIEERPAAEVTEGFGSRTAPKNVRVYNPAFDVTPARLIRAIITERGVLRPPFSRSIREAFAVRRNSKLEIGKSNK